ncbi:ELWxxDGT repeat protein [Planktothrix pseudagardhii]|uniref:Mannuronan C5-epimerase AlgE1 n=1 Tax=Planktothrix pseudagardhii TaxID=132604 RepID=A0A9W4CU91_9CYAN|nr:ELWxxDGT repeat protein [Planktothrix pseudagardhii]CAD5988435.1 Mannuronan C5-epimerase AlgE1 [Planktothrix pseudagardhii]
MATLQDLAKTSAFGNSFGFPTFNSAAVQEILFLDTGVTDYPLLAAGVRTGVEVVLVHSYEDGVQQITHVLKQRQNIQTVHIVAHGSPGCLYLGNSQLNIKTLSYYADQLQYWSVSNLLLYGCYVGANPIFLQELKQLTGATIGATQTIIGNSELERNWDLEVTTGEMNISPVFEEQVIASYSSILGAVLVKDINPNGSSSPSTLDMVYNLTNINGTLYFRANDGINGFELWKSDGTPEGTILVKNINPGSSDSLPGFLINVNGTLYFHANDGVHGIELWKSDGTTAGTVLIKNIRLENIKPGFVSSVPENFVNLNNSLFFQADDGVHGSELWKSDGTEAGTVLVKDIYPYFGSDGYPGIDSYTQMVNINNILYFSADDGIHESSLWKSDGTEAGTVLVKDINPFPPATGQPEHFKNVNGTLYFICDDGVHGSELWKSDGTEAGTVLVKDINPGTVGSFIVYLANVNQTLYFEATVDDPNQPVGLWKSDGTTAGTVLVKNIEIWNPPTNVNGIVYFTAYDSNNGLELWKSDGTSEGTVLVKDINLGSNSSNPNYLTDINGVLYFTATDGINGVELWKSDGTPEGTVLVSDINLGTGSSYPNNLIDVNGTLYFQANDGIHGYELWKLSDVDTISPIATTFTPTDNTTNVSTNTNLVINFSEPIQKGTGNIVIRKVPDNSTVETIDVTSTNVTITNNKMTINPNLQLEGGLQYYIQIADGAIKDSSGNKYSGITNNTDWNFETSRTGTATDDILNGTEADDTLSGAGGNDLLIGYSGNDLLNGGTGADTSKGGTGNDTYVVDNGGDIVTELAAQGTDLVQSSITYTLPAEVENLTLTGTSAINGTGNILANTLTGNTANNILNGSTGADQLKGSSGNDTYIVDNAGDIVTELASQGTDLIQSSVTYTLPGEVENLTLTGTTAINGTGNALANIITGNTTNNILTGGAGNDTYVVANAGDIVTELASQGTDLIQSSVTYTLPANVENLTLTGTTAINGTGNTLVNILTGNTANNILNGSSGADQLKGSTGNDTYVVDNAGDIVIELASGGTDLVQSSVTYTLPANVENLTLTGTTAINGTGNTLANIITGNTANNILNGSTGADQLKGSTGNDTYVVDNAGDIVTELATQGTDLVQSSITYTLPAEVENQILIGTSAINGTGNTLTNTITGNTANNILNGSTGADQLKGSTGNDTYVVDNAGDIVTELVAQGTDLVQSSITYTLPGEVENLTLTGTAAINGTGNTLANIITGNTANNILNGSTGNDNLIGSSGADQLLGSDGNDSLSGDAANDTLTGGLGADKFIYNTNAVFATSAVGVDTITDFNISQTDQIVLDKTTFTSISSIAGTGFSVATEFAKVTTDALAATSAADIVYNTATGGLFYNQNGAAAGFGTGSQFLILTEKPVLASSQFLIQA